MRENLRYFAAVLGAPPGDPDRVLEAVVLQAEADAVVGRSRAVSAPASRSRSRCSDRPSLVLDEPTVGLDPVLRAELWGMFHALAAGGISLLVSSHVMDEATRCDELVLMRDGTVLAQETPAGLLARTGARDTEEAFLSLIHGDEDAG